MPISDTWVGLSPMDSITSVSSVESCNSVTSSNSAFSDEYLDYLSAEERECLMFLEETIDSLDTEADNGISTNELERTESSAEIGSMLEKTTVLHPEIVRSQNTEPDGKIPRAVSPNSNRNSTDSTSPQMVRAKSGANTLPKYNPKPSIESTLSSNRLSESSRNPIFSGNTRQRSHTTSVQHQLVESKDDKAKLGPPTAPKPRKLPSNIILKSCHKNDGLMVSSTNSPNSFKIPKAAPRSNGYNLSGDSGTDGEVQQIRMEALTKLGLLSEPDGQKRNLLRSQKSLKTQSAPISQTVTAGDEMRTNQPEVTVRDNKTNSLKYPSIGIDSPSSNSAASTVIPGVNSAANRPSSVIVGNVNKAQWQLGASKSSSLKRFSTPGENILPSASHGSALNISAATALNPGMSNTIPIARRSANVNEGHLKNIVTPQWPLGATKTSSLKRFGTANDNNQPTLYSGIAQNTSVAAAAVPGLNKYIRPRPVSICSETDLSVRHGSTLEAVSSDKPGRKSFPITINHISAKFQKSPPKGLNVQVTPQGPTSKDHKEALRKLGLLKE